MFDFVYDIIANGDARIISCIIDEMQRAIEAAEEMLSELEDEENAKKES